MTEMIDEASSRIVAGYLAIGNSANAAATEISYAELRGVLRPDRTYKMRVCPHKMDADSAGSVAEPRLRVAYDGAAVTTSSTLVQSGRRYADSTVAGGFAGLEYIFTTAGQSADLRDVRFGYNLARWSGSGNVWIVSDSTSPVVMYLEDCGPAIQFSSTVSTYTSTWRATEVYQNGITPKLGAGGFSIGHSFSDDWAQAVFAGNAISGETGKTIATALSGGTMVKAEVMSTLSPFEENSLINARFRTNTYTAANAAAPSGTAVDASKATSGTWRAWVDITANFTLTSRGIWVGGPDIGPAMMYADSGNDGFLVRLTYKR